MSRLGTLVLAVAAVSSALAANGLAVAPHLDPPGTPLFHEHPLASYRYTLSLAGAERSDPEPGPGWRLETPSELQLDGIVLAMVAPLLVTAVPRPARRVANARSTVLLRGPQWRAGAPRSPPRAYLLATA